MKSAAAARRIFAALERHYPDADTELAYTTPFELLVATILSAQSTDARVNHVTPALFARYPDAAAMAGATPEALEPIVLSTGFFRQKARALIAMANALMRDHRGAVPAEMAALVALPGVGRKTANVVLGHALGVPGLPVDRHVLRVSNRLGLVHNDDPVVVERQLCEYLPAARWTKASDTLILHGRRICRPTPLCSRCHARRDCDFYVTGAVSKPRGARGRRPPLSGAATTGAGRPATARTRATGARRRP